MNRLKELRKEKGLTQQELSKAIAAPARSIQQSIAMKIFQKNLLRPFQRLYILHLFCG